MSYPGWMSSAQVCEVLRSWSAVTINHDHRDTADRWLRDRYGSPFADWGLRFSDSDGVFIINPTNDLIRVLEIGAWDYARDMDGRGFVFLLKEVNAAIEFKLRFG